MAARKIPRRNSASGSAAGGRLVLFLLAMTAAYFFRASGAPFVSALRDSVREVMLGDLDYREAVAVAGRALAGEPENAVLVWGGKILDAGKKIGETILS